MTVFENYLNLYEFLYDLSTHIQLKRIFALKLHATKIDIGQQELNRLLGIFMINEHK